MKLAALRERARRAPRRAAPPRAGGVDRRQRQRPRPGQRARRHQAVGRPLRGPDRRVDGRRRPRTATVVEGDLKPSSDTASHLYIYRHRPDVNGVVHTHSRYATALAAVGRPIPVVLTGQADEFGGEIPCAGLSLVGDEGIGKLVVESIGRSPAVLLKHHGVFTVGPTAEAAVKAAVMTEDVAATTFLALQLGDPEAIPADLVERFHERYTKVYGQ